ncbi:hypothetical protein HPB48_021588 [Haemaphysalis longicornis]|uniref:Uncharacterized protein n=1 Tax=Haemaphysalis longicornis TaxID=44386 RepID=A0A9J6FD99_HAELO|nr:hypothetical protein HPB48_021588 [Haemaphysalis longicornis]
MGPFLFMKKASATSRQTAGRTRGGRTQAASWEGRLAGPGNLREAEEREKPSGSSSELGTFPALMRGLTMLPASADRTPRRPGATWNLGVQDEPAGTSAPECAAAEREPLVPDGAAGDPEPAQCTAVSADHHVATLPSQEPELKALEEADRPGT